MALSPTGFWRSVSVEPRRVAGLVPINLALAALLAAGAAYPNIVGHVPAVSAVALALGLAVLLLALSSVEYLGIRFLGRRHGFRITREVALTVCGHATFAWVLAGALVGLTGQIVQRVPALWNGSMGLAGGFNRGVLTAGSITLAAGLAGVTMYSVMCGIGYRAMRYANR